MTPTMEVPYEVMIVEDGWEIIFSALSGRRSTSRGQTSSLYQVLELRETMENFLSLSGIVAPPAVEPSIKFGDHIFLDVSFRDHSNDICSYWRLVDRDFSLIEIGVDATSFQLRSFTVPLYNGDFLITSGEIGSTERKGFGMPVFDGSLWACSKATIFRINTSSVPLRSSFPN